MTDPSLSAEELAALRRRWEQGATPQLALQLAEEHKRRSEHDLAVEVLERAVADNPSHLAVRVAAGRLRLELGDLTAAAADLEAVVERDPTHLVANKLLVRVYSGLGEPLRARDRLDLYELLNESDPEIDDLEALVPPGGVVEIPPASGEHEPEPVAASESGAAPAETPLDPEPVVVSKAPAPGGDEPFPGLWDDLDTAGYWHQVEDGQIFGASVAEPQLPLVAPAAPAAPAELEEESGAWESEAAEPWSGPLAADVESEPVAPPAAERAPSEEAGPAEERKSRSASVTLAALYHQQGHLEEARRTYWQVLERDPSNREALDGMARLARSGPTELTAFDLLGEELPSDPQARRRQVLEGYLARLKRGETGVV